MGLISSTVDTITDGVGTAVNAADEVVFGENSASETKSYKDPSIDQTVHEAESSVNEGAEQLVTWTDYSLEGGTDGTMQMLQTGVDTFQGFLMTVAGAFNFMKNLVGFVPFEEVKGFLQMLFGGMAGLFEGLAGFVGAVEAYIGFVEAATGLEAAAFILGTLLMFLGGYLIFSGIVSGEILLFTSFVEDVFDGIMGMFIGLGLVIWATNNFVGGIILTGAGLMLLGYALEAGEDGYIPFGIPSLLMGVPMMWGALGFRFTGVTILSIPTFIAAIYALELLTSDAGATAFRRFADSLVEG